MTGLVIGVMGHVDHGKTALVRALTGMETDRLPEEQRRGLSIALGFAHMETEDGTAIDLVDMPGHERFVRTLIGGATGIDALLLIVAADEGVMPQTAEHATIAGLLGLRRTIIAVTKTDLTGAAEAAVVAEQARELLSRNGLQISASVMTSVKTGEGISALRSMLLSLAGTGRRAEEGAPAFLPVDRAFTMAGHGVVVTGTLRGAPVRPGDRLHLFPGSKEVHVRTVQTRGVQQAAAAPGQRVALNLRNVTLDEARRGAVLATRGTLAQSDWLTITLNLPEQGDPLRNGQSLLALIGTDQIECRLRLLDHDGIEAGDSGLAQLHCTRPVAFPAGEHVILRTAGPPRTVGGGRILEPVIRRRPRHRPHLLDRLRALRDLTPPGLILSELDAEGSGGVMIDHLARLCARTEEWITGLLADLPVVIARGGRVFRQSDMDRSMEQIPLILASNPAGMSRNQLLSALPGTRAVLLDEALRRLLADKRIVSRGSQWMAPQPDRDDEIARSQDALERQLDELFHSAGLTPPQPAAITADPQNRRAVERLLRKGRIIRAIDRAKGREILFHRDAIDTAKQQLLPLLCASDGLLVTEIGAALGISRKFTMPLLAHLDAIRFTERKGDRRIAKSKREDEMKTCGH